MINSSKNTSRTAFAAKSSFYGLVGKGVSLLASFLSRTVFIYTLGKYYLGVNGLYTEILSFLSFAELGFGSAMAFALYGPVERCEDEKVRELMQFYKVTYRIIALVVLFFGIIVTPFLQFIVKGAEGLSLFELRLYFVIFLVNTVTTYFVTYKFGYSNALQESYVSTNVDTITNLACVSAQLLALALTRSFLIYLLANTITLIVSRFFVSIYMNRRYPILRERPKNELSKQDQKGILNEVKGLAVHQFAGVAVHATDSIIISSIPTLGVSVVGAVSNYNLVINAVSAIVLIIFNSVVAGFGNLAVTSSKEHFEKVFEETNFANFWIYGVFTVCFVVLLTPFVTLWAGFDYVIDSASLVFIIFNFYLQGQSTIYNNARIAKGNFNMDKWWSLLQAFVNLFVSVFAALRFGLVGVYVGTVASRLIFVICRPCSTYRFLFGRSPLEYFKKLLLYLGCVVVATVVCASVCAPLLANLSWITVIVSAVICLIVPNIIFYFIFKNSHEYEALCGRMSHLLGVDQ